LIITNKRYLLYLSLFKKNITLSENKSKKKKIAIPYIVLFNLKIKHIKCIYSIKIYQPLFYSFFLITHFRLKTLFFLIILYLSTYLPKLFSFSLFSITFNTFTLLTNNLFSFSQSTAGKKLLLNNFIHASLLIFFTFTTFNVIEFSILALS